MAEEVKEKRSKPSAGTKVTFKVSQYKPGMEKHASFEGVSFYAPLEPGDSTDPKGKVNPKRQALMTMICKEFDVKPLGAVSAPSGSGKRAAQADALYINALKDAGCSAGKAFQIVKVATLASVSLKALTLEELTAKYFTS